MRKKHINFPTSYQEIPQQIRGEIGIMLLQEKLTRADLSKIVFLLLQENSYLLEQLPFESFLPHITFLLEAQSFDFPDIQDLRKPQERLYQMSIEQFCFCDYIFSCWLNNGNTQQKQVMQRQLTACLYLNKETNFSYFNLSKIAEITDSQPKNIHQDVLFSFACCRKEIAKKYPLIFKTPREQEQMPVFGKKSNTLKQVIISMSLEQNQPLGDYLRCKESCLYDFFDVLQQKIKTEREIC